MPNPTIEISGRTEDVKHGDHTGYFFADVELPLRDLFAAFLRWQG